MKTIIDLSDKKILVTGASSGIGRETAILLSQIGAQVVLVARNEAQILETIKKMETPDKHAYYAMDLLDFDAIEGMISQSVQKDGIKYSGLVHCAGICAFAPLTDLSLNFQEDKMAINYYAFLELVRQITKKKNCADGCSIVGISSVAAFRGGASQTAYSATKAALDAAIISLSKELSERGLRINSVRPGVIWTDEMDAYMEKYSCGLGSVAKSQLLGFGEAIDVANLAAFLLSPASKYITGQNFVTDGGAA